MGCGDQQTAQPAKIEKQEKINAQVGHVKFAFYYPVVMVNGKRAQKKDSENQEYQEWIEVSYPQNSTQNIILTIADGEGAEHELRGQIKVSQYTCSIPEQKGPVVVRPKNPEDYATILKAGYGDLFVTEYINDPEKGEIKGPVVAQLMLGTKKKSDGTIEFRFREGSVHTIQGKTPPTSMFFKENSKHSLTITLEEGTMPLQGSLEIFQGGQYTELAPVWFSLDEKVKEYLRSQGGSAKVAFYIPSPEYQNSDTVTTSISPDENPELVAKRYGSIVAMLTLRRAK